MLLNHLQNKSPDLLEIFATCGGPDGMLCKIDPAQGKVKSAIPTGHTPMSPIISPDGKTVYVCNRFNNDVSVIDTASKTVVKTIPLPDGSHSLRGACMSSDGKHLYITHVLSRYHLPTTQLERGWMNTSAVTIIDSEAKELVNTVLLDDVDVGAANPWGIACTADGKYLCIALAGTHEVMVIDLPASVVCLGPSTARL